MTANGMDRPCSCPASDRLARGAETRSTPCLRQAQTAIAPIPRTYCGVLAELLNPIVIPVADNFDLPNSGAIMLAPTEARKRKRQPSRRAAWINLGNHCPPVRCVLWDISDGGARLTAARNVEDLPDRFELTLNEATQRTCRVIWRDKRFLGVAFVDLA